MIAIAVLVGLVAVAVVSGARRGLWLPVGLVLGGTVSNVIDRVHYGAVTDFLVVAP